MTGRLRRFNLAVKGYLRHRLIFLFPPNGRRFLGRSTGFQGNRLNTIRPKRFRPRLTSDAPEGRHENPALRFSEFHTEKIRQNRPCRQGG